MNVNTENSIVKGSLIYEAGDEITSVSLILNGSVKYMSDNGERTETYKAGDFVGVDDIFSGYYSGDYEAMSDTYVITLGCSDIEEFADSIRENAELITKHNAGKCLLVLLNSVYKMYKSLFSEIEGFYASIANAHSTYTDICAQNFLAPEDFIMVHTADNYDIKNLSFFDTLYNITHDVANASTEEIIDTICNFLISFEDLIFYLKALTKTVLSQNNNCLFGLIANLSGSLDGSSSVAELMDDMRSFTTEMYETIKDQFGIELNIDLGRINFYCSLSQTGGGPVEEAGVTQLRHFDDSHSSVLTDSFDKLMEYCSYSMEDMDRFKDLIDRYKDLTDKAGTDDVSRALRREIINEFYKLYENVFFTYAKTKREELYVDLFLNFGLMDETLLDDDSIDFLCNFKYNSGGIPSMVYYMKDWLLEIYEGTRIPSKNEFDEEYVDYIRSKKKEMALSPEAERALLEDCEAKVKYELNNMFKYTHRILNGAPTSFYPMLTCGDDERTLASMCLSAEKINQALKSILQVDYSAFYRESLYENIQAGISKEVIVKEVFPEFILLPCAGVNGIMWQEISGKRINNPGRFILPAFFAADLSTTLLKLIGRFRWELCKTTLGVAWNDITVPSLTSEYSDYIQFYRKNHDLSAEKKEALKNQIARCRNNMRDVFVMDYCVWIKYESTGAMRLNKLSRKMLATYCPFAKNLREKYAGHPAFAEAMTKFNLERAKKCREITNRYNSLSRKGIELTDELIITEDYYMNM